MKLYRVLVDSDAWYEFVDYHYVNVDCVYRDKKVAEETLIAEIKKAFSEEPRIWKDVEDTEEEALAWWLENHFDIVEVEVR